MARATTNNTNKNVTQPSIDTKQVVEPVQTEEVEVATTSNSESSNTKKKPTLALDTMVDVINNTRGLLVYKSTKTNGYKVEWSRYGEAEPMELSELISMRNSQRRFFEKNWILIRDEEVLRYLGVEKLYETMLGIKDIDEIFRMTPSEIREKLKNAPDGLKETISLKSKARIEAKQLNDLSIINAIEDVLGYKLIEIIV